jgi:hypothetical protein
MEKMGKLTDWSLSEPFSFDPERYQHPEYSHKSIGHPSQTSTSIEFHRKPAWMLCLRHFGGWMGILLHNSYEVKNVET